MPRPRAIYLLVVAVMLLVGCDHATKHLAKRHLGAGPSIELVAGVLDLTYTENRDVAFNALRVIPEGVRRPLILIANLAVFALLGVFAVRTQLLQRRALIGGAGLALALAGGLGNFTDRAIRGYVVDFIHLHHWPVFNVADVLIVAGLALLAWASYDRATPQKMP